MLVYQGFRNGKYTGLNPASGNSGKFNFWIINLSPLGVEKVEILFKFEFQNHFVRFQKTWLKRIVSLSDILSIYYSD